jgi:hypothetical protein
VEFQCSEIRSSFRYERAEHAVAVCVHHLVEKRTELHHRVFHFALGSVLDGFVGRVAGVFDELRDFDRVLGKYQRHLRDVVGGSGTAAELAAARSFGDAGACA